METNWITTTTPLTVNGHTKVSDDWILKSRMRKLAVAGSLAASLLALSCMMFVVNSPKKSVLVSEFYGEGSVTKEMFSGRCRCVGYLNPDPEHNVVCACSGKDDIWNKGPWMIVTGYSVAVDTNQPGGAKYLTVQGLGYPEGPKKAIHYYTLIRPWDDFGSPTMPDLFPDGHLGIPEDGFALFDTTAIKKYPSFRATGGAIGHRQMGLRMAPFTRAQDVVHAELALAKLFK